MNKKVSYTFIKSPGEGGRVRVVSTLALCLVFILGATLACEASVPSRPNSTPPQNVQQAGTAAVMTAAVMTAPAMGPAASQAAPSTNPQAPTQNSVFLPNLSPGEGSTAAPGASPAAESPRVDIQVNLATLKVGEMLTVTGRPAAIGMPVYNLVVQDEGAQGGAVLGQVSYEGKINPQNGTSQTLEIVSAEGKMDQVMFVLKAKAPGKATVSITADGEVKTDSGAYAWGGGGSEGVAVTVTQ